MDDKSINLEEQVFNEQLRLLYQQLPGAAVVPNFGAVLIAAIHWDVVPRQQLLLWLAVELLLVGIAGWCLWRYYQNSFSRRPDPRYWTRWFLVYVVGAGAIWGSSAFVFSVDGALQYQMVVLGFLYSAVAMAALTVTAYPPAFYAVASSMLLLLAAQLFANKSGIHQLLGVSTLVYLVGIIYFYRNVHHGLLNSIRLWFERNELVQELEQRRREAEQANEAKTQFFAAASHDLRQPLRAQSFFIEELERLEPAPAQNAVLQKLRLTNESLQQSFDSLLDISRLDASAVVVRKEAVAVDEVLAEVQMQFQEIAMRRGLRLRVVRSRMVVNTDRALSLRILSNLVENALRYTREGGVLLGSRRGANGLRLVVADTGAGIPAAHGDHIFEAFYRIPAELDGDTARGFGLGLAIVKRLAELLGHRLDMRSRPGRGTSFSLWLPIVADHTASIGVR